MWPVLDHSKSITWLYLVFGMLTFTAQLIVSHVKPFGGDQRRRFVLNLWFLGEIQAILPLALL
ncbi:hypothetical protein GCM10007972_08960 [Iodidimonas muriae]|uniref:Uncharacterized protein n=1 Tax=Iodidimonas muriae TaxID=261467 RepID=A0ABQ2LAL7_9PROT|nr:hypothetical protein JCM17843_04770 [Kordiimonadales bacterium JCM 17843]GGO08515.1 hypothetical protein GCM10007972_08960 [Iodidimonas muriae]